MLRGAVLLSAVSLVLTLPAAASDVAATKSVTIRVVSTAKKESFKDVAPKGPHFTKGDTLRGTSILRNAVPQFDRPKGARVGTDSYMFVAQSSQKFKVDVVARFPGGTVRASGVVKISPSPKTPIIMGTGLYAGATGSTEAHQLRGGVTLDIYRLQVPS